ncbi:MAG: hypothetical protein ACK4M3_01690 [Pyrobaculum sp.]
MVEYVEVGTANRQASIYLTNLTFITGVGKSTFLEILYSVLSNVGRKIPNIGKTWRISIQDKDVSYSIQADPRRVRQNVVVKGEEVVFEYIPHKSLHKLIKPIDIGIANADVIIPEIRTKEHVSIIAEEDLDRLANLLNEARRRLDIHVKILGPYLSPRSLVDSTTSHVLDRYGRNLTGVLAYLSLYKPTAYDSIKTQLKKLGLSLSVGLAKPGKIGAFLITKSTKLPLSKAPCSIKSFLAISTALELRPDLLIIDNFDFCLTRQVAGVLSSVIRQKDVKILAELHNQDFADWIDVSKTVAEVKL